MRAEYPLAVHRLTRAIEQARQSGVLGDNIMGRGFRFDIQLVEGAGAFVCGEETALIASLEGFAGRPRPRPPFPAQKGLCEQPTNINNVETWYNVAPIVSKGPAWFSETGSTKSAGTKVFSLVGKIANTGLVEMPLGTPLKTFIYDVGEGGSNGKHIKAVQTGGPSGGCIPQEMFDTPVDYETLAQLGSIMGSGGMVVMDEDNCMVDVARYFIEFTHSESCGKCVPCRVGLDQSLRMLNAFTRGRASEADLDRLDEMGRMIRDTSLCGLGTSAPNPLLTTMRHFRHEFEDHIRAKRCRAGVCEDLALSPCENSCPLHMNIPRFLQLYQEGRLEDAFEAVVLDNPLPCSTGRVCQHPCDNRCRRSSIDEAVNMREVHRFIADTIYQSDRFDAMVERVVAHKLPATDRKVAVVGGGPTGLAAAFYLALLGHEVTVYESNPEPGGMLRYALPEYRLPRETVRREVELIRRLGVNFVCGVAVGTDIPLNDLDNQYNAVFLAIGTWKEAWVYLPGTELNGVIPALPFLESVSKEEPVRLGRKVVVIGGGNAAIDSARTALRMRLRCHHHLPPRAQGHARHTGRDRGRRGGRREVRFPGHAAPHRGRCQRQRQRHRSGEDPARRVRLLRPPPSRAHRRNPAHGLRHRDPGRGRSRGYGFRPRLRPAHQRERNARGGPLHPGNQPQQVLRRRRPDYRRFQRLQRHGLRQEGGPQHRPAPDGAGPLGPDRRPHSSTARRPPNSPAKAAATRFPSCPRSSASRASAKPWSGLSAEEALDEARRCLRCDIKDHH